MKRIFHFSFAATAILLLTVAFTSHARCVYGPVSANGVTSLNVAGSTHGIGSKYIGLVATTSGGARLAVGTDFSISVNPTTYDVSVTFTNAFTGAYRLVGVYANYTTASTDFQVTGNYAWTGLNVCAACGSAYAARRLTGPDSGVAHNYAMDETASITVTYGISSGRIYAYLTQSGILFQIQTGMTVSASGGNAHVVAVSDPSVRPFDGIVLGYGTFNWDKLMSVTDRRNF